MKITFNNVLVMVFILVITLVLVRAPLAAEKGYPSKPITIINPYPPGGGVDVAARGIAKEMQSILGQPVLVESKAGAEGQIGGQYVRNAKPDGYTIGFFNDQSFIPEVFTPFREASYTSKDLKPVVRCIVLPYGLASNVAMPWNNLNEFIKYTQGNPNKFRVGAAGIGGAYTILYFYFAKKNTLETIFVPFKGSGEVAPAMLGGHIDLGMVSIPSVAPFIKTGKMKMLAVHYPMRMQDLPEIPTFEEQGYLPGFPYNATGFFVPNGTPEEIVRKIDDVVKKATQSASLKTYAREQGFDLYYGSASDLMKDLMKEREIMGPLVEEMAKTMK
jgi:tripartite-type tricarboxylate transporter receptor subunit TctC